MKVTVIGSGLAGLRASVYFAQNNINVTCIESNVLSNVEFYTKEQFQSYVFNHKIQLTSNFEEGIKDADVIFLTMDEYSEYSNSDVSSLLECSEKIAVNLTKYAVIVDISSLFVGVTENIKNKISEYSNVAFDVVASAGFWLSNYSADWEYEDYNLQFGAESEKAKEILSQLFLPLLTSNSSLEFKDVKSIEIANYAKYTFQTMKNSLIKEIADMGLVYNVDIDVVSKVVKEEKTPLNVYNFQTFNNTKQLTFNQSSTAESYKYNDLNYANKVVNTYDLDFNTLDDFYSIALSQLLRC